MGFLQKKEEVSQDVEKDNILDQDLQLLQKEKSNEDLMELKALKQKIMRKQLDIQDHVYYLKRPAVKESHFTTIVLLNSLYKSVMLTNGLEPDSGSSPEYILVRDRINNSIKGIPEVQEAIQLLKENHMKFT